MSKMFLLYKKKCVKDNKPECFNITESTYRNILCQHFNLNFGSPRSDSCSRCDAGEANNVKHILSYKAAFECQPRDRENATDNLKICYITMDLQQTISLPNLFT